MTEIITMQNGTTIGVSSLTSRQVMMCIAKNVPILAEGERLVIDRTSKGWDVSITSRSN